MRKGGGNGSRLMMFWLGVAGAVLVAIYLVIVDNKDDF